MGQWVVTVAGIAILSVLCDIILPDGQTRKYIKTVIGVIVTLVMLQPLANLLSESFIKSNYQSEGYSDVRVQHSYLDMVDDKQLQSHLSSAEKMLQARGVNVEVLKLDKYDKTIDLQSDSSYSANSESVINEIFDTYFADYKIKIKWK